ncbi:MAG: peptidylprolyl isomerase [Bacteroidia bacterium]
MQKEASRNTNAATGPKEDILEINTSYGKMYVWLYKATPLHRENYLKLGREGYLNNTTFHRVIPDFMIQGGDPNSKDTDPNNDGQGGPGYTIPAEIRDSIKHHRGVMAAARTNNPEKASSGSQFYISVSTSGTAGLDGNYTVFGEVMSGIEFGTVSLNNQGIQITDHLLTRKCKFRSYKKLFLNLRMNLVIHPNFN